MQQKTQHRKSNNNFLLITSHLSFMNNIISWKTRAQNKYVIKIPFKEQTSIKLR